MGLSVRQLRVFVIRPVLTTLGLYSPAAEDLVLGTAIHESGGLKYVDQITGPNDNQMGPALGLWQIEPESHQDLFDNYLRYRPELRSQLLALRAPFPQRHHQLIGNMFYSAGVCRVDYYREPEPLPVHGDIEGYARYWKLYWNSTLGKGTEEEFISNWNHYSDGV